MGARVRARAVVRVGGWGEGGAVAHQGRTGLTVVDRPPLLVLEGR